MKEVRDNSVSFVITSPPYWNLDIFSRPQEDLLKGDLSRIRERKEFFRELARVWQECYRVLKPGGYLVCEFEDYPVGSWVYGYPREIFLAGEMHNSIESSGLYLIARWFWKKFESGVALSKFKYTTYSNLQKGFDPRAIANLAYCFVYKKYSSGKQARILEFTRDDWIKWSDSLWEIQANTEAGAEAKWGISGGAVFPEELVKRFILLYTRKGQTVLDPFLGTGTSMRVALLLGRNAIGYEILPKMLPIIKQKVGWGRSSLIGEEIEWKLIVRAH